MKLDRERSILTDAYIKLDSANKFLKILKKDYCNHLIDSINESQKQLVWILAEVNERINENAKREKVV